MSDAGLDPVIHAPVRLRITVTLSTLREGDYLSFSRLQQLLDLTPGNLITHLRKLEEAGYVGSVKPVGDGQARTALYLTHAGRAALERYTAALRQLLDQASPANRGEMELVQRPVTDQLMVCGAISGVPTSSCRFSWEPSGALRGSPTNTRPFTITVTCPRAGPAWSGPSG